MTIDFKPQQSAFSRCQVIWRDICLNGIKHSVRPKIDLSDGDLTEIILDLYPSLSLSEMARFYDLVEKNRTLSDNFNWNQFFKHHGLQFNQRFTQLLKALVKTPAEFQAWVTEKKASPSDLMPLLALKNSQGIETFLRLFSDQKLSRSQGRLVLDLLVDLLLMDFSSDQLTPNTGDWGEQLKALRYPQTAEQDRNKTLDLNLPSYAKVQSQRNGDRLLHNLQIQFLDEKDLQRKLQNLQSQLDRDDN